MKRENQLLKLQGKAADNTCKGSMLYRSKLSIGQGATLMRGEWAVLMKGKANDFGNQKRRALGKSENVRT